MAQERKKRRIVLASILKPVDDTRMFEKMGISLAKTGDYEVFIAGYSSLSQASFPGIIFISKHPFPRLSVKRLLAKWQTLRAVWKLKPSILIFNTHELLLPAVFLKAFTKCSIIYDVRENYYRNILYGGSFPGIVRLWLALLVRLKENVLSRFINYFFLAEQGYENEFRFHRRGWTVLENKASPLPSPALAETASVRKPERAGVRLLFSGTLAETTGVFRAIQLAKELNRLDSNVSLTIVGHAGLKVVEKKILHEVEQNKFITLIGGDSLVPHPIILQHIQNASAGIISYPLSSHVLNSVPTKLFEYLCYRLPIILERHWPWIERYSVFQPFVFFDFENPDYPAILQDLKTQNFYPTTPLDVTWESEEPKLLDALKRL